MTLEASLDTKVSINTESTGREHVAQISNLKSNSFLNHFGENISVMKSFRFMGQK